MTKATDDRLTPNAPESVELVEGQQLGAGGSRRARTFDTVIKSRSRQED